MGSIVVLIVVLIAVSIAVFDALSSFRDAFGCSVVVASWFRIGVLFWFCWVCVFL